MTNHSRILIGSYLMTFAPIVSAHPLLRTKFKSHVMHRARALSSNNNNNNNNNNNQLYLKRVNT